MKRAGKQSLPPHVLKAVEEKARTRRLDERAFFWAEVAAVETGVGGAKSHGRCLPDELDDVFPELVKGAEGADTAVRDDDATVRRLAEAYDDVPVTVDAETLRSLRREEVFCCKPRAKGSWGLEAIRNSGVCALTAPSKKHAC